MAVQARRAKDKLRVVKERPDIVLRDIAMPSGSGLDLLPNIDPEIKIVFTTAQTMCRGSVTPEDCRLKSKS